MQRGEVYRFKVPKGLGHEQQGERYGLVVGPDPVRSARTSVVASAEQQSIRLGEVVLVDPLAEHED